MGTSYEGVIVSAIGEFGLSQFLIVSTVKLSVVIAGYAMVMTSLIGAEPDWSLHVSYHDDTKNTTETEHLFKACPSAGNNGKVVFEENVDTIVTEWKLICEREWIPRTIMTVQMTGAIVAPSLVAQCADSYGRKKSLLVTYCIILTSVLGHGLSPNWQTMMVFAFTLGFGIAGLLVVCNIYYLEFVGTKWRTVTGSLPAWAVGVMILGGTWVAKPSWRHLCYINFTAGCPVVVLLMLSPESIRWMLTHNQVEKAKKTLVKLAQVNQRDEPDLGVVNEMEVAGDAEVVRYTYCTLLQHRFTRWRVVVFSFIWFTMSFGYYAITFGVGTHGGNMGVNMFFQGVAEVLAVLLVIGVSGLAGRRWSSVALISVTSAALFSITVAYLVADDKTYAMLKLVFALVAKLFIAASWVNITLFTIETFPTVIRNIAFGMASMVSRIGGALAPQNIVLHNIETHLPFTFNGVLQVVSALLCLCLTDTYSSQLQDHFEAQEEETEENERLIENE